MRRVIAAIGAAAILTACGGGDDAGGAGGAAADAPARVAVALPAAYRGVDLAPGRDEARKCLLCHTVPDGAPHSVGPNLHALFGRTVGAAPGYDFSPALREADFVWTPEQLDAWLTDPNGFLPGTRMTFPGVFDEEVRASLIAYLYEETGGSAPADMEPGPGGEAP